MYGSSFSNSHYVHTANSFKVVINNSQMWNMSVQRMMGIITVLQANVKKHHTKYYIVDRVGLLNVDLNKKYIFSFFPSFFGDSSCTFGYCRCQP